MSKVCHELELDKLFKDMHGRKKFEYNSESIMSLLAYSRILYPHSKKRMLEIKGKYLDLFGFSLVDAYDYLTHFGRSLGHI
ncbi:MAG: hypothetical protein LBU32_29500 [Clostridiales bacterium]|nr:hypothetical protein [Clostridiales bacterium]